MGLIRGGVLTIVSVLFLLSLLVGGLFLTLNKSLDYNVVQPQLVSIVGDLIENQTDISSGVSNNIYTMTLYCQNNTDFVFKNKELDYVFVIPCDIVEQGEESIVDFAIEEKIKESYYKDYECGLWDCLSSDKDIDSAFILVSQNARDYWKGKFYFMLIISFILVALIFLLAEKKSNGFLVVGILFAVSSIPFIKAEIFLLFLLRTSFSLLSLSGGLTEENVERVLSILFTGSFSVFVILFLVGLVIFIVGVLLKFFGIGFKISGFFNKFGRQKQVVKFKPVEKKIPLSKNKSK